MEQIARINLMPYREKIIAYKTVCFYCLLLILVIFIIYVNYCFSSKLLEKISSNKIIIDGLHKSKENILKNSSVVIEQTKKAKLLEKNRYIKSVLKDKIYVTPVLKRLSNISSYNYYINKITFVQDVLTIEINSSSILAACSFITKAQTSLVNFTLRNIGFLKNKEKPSIKKNHESFVIVKLEFVRDIKDG